MAITFLQLSQQLNKVAGQLDGPEHGNIMVQLASDALTMNKERVQKQGVDDEGGKYNPYSTKPMLASRKGMTGNAYASIAGSKEKRKNLDWVTIKGHRLFEIPGGYKQYRELHGRQTSIVDFMFTGRMWGNIKLVSGRAELNSGVAVLKPTEDIEKKKLSGLTKKRGDILALSKKEENELAHTYESWLQRLLKRNGL